MQDVLIGLSAIMEPGETNFDKDTNRREAHDHGCNGEKCKLIYIIDVILIIPTRTYNSNKSLILFT